MTRTWYYVVNGDIIPTVACYPNDDVGDVLAGPFDSKEEAYRELDHYMLEWEYAELAPTIDEVRELAHNVFYNIELGDMTPNEVVNWIRDEGADQWDINTKYYSERDWRLLERFLEELMERG